jgi:hypothetical protein
VIRGFIPMGGPAVPACNESLPPGLILGTGQDDAGEHAG